VAVSSSGGQTTREIGWHLLCFRGLRGAVCTRPAFMRATSHRPRTFALQLRHLLADKGLFYERLIAVPSHVKGETGKW
jgi:hypothetical protein